MLRQGLLLTLGVTSTKTILAPERDRLGDTHPPPPFGNRVMNCDMVTENFKITLIASFPNYYCH
jgi:hypothetical protein